MGADAPTGLVTNLTWAGHDFAEAARDETRWKNVMKTVKEKGGSVTIDVLKALLTKLMEASFGLS